MVKKKYIYSVIVDYFNNSIKVVDIARRGIILFERKLVIILSVIEKGEYQRLEISK